MLHVQRSTVHLQSVCLKCLAIYVVLWLLLPSLAVRRAEFQD